jgi:hypothetical protein
MNENKYQQSTATIYLRPFIIEFVKKMMIAQDGIQT